MRYTGEDQRRPAGDGELCQSRPRRKPESSPKPEMRDSKMPKIAGHGRVSQLISVQPRVMRELTSPIEPPDGV